MTDKEKYMVLMQRYWEADTTLEEEMALARYVARVDDMEFKELKGVLGYLSIGKEKSVRKAGIIRLFPILAGAAGIAAVVVIGFSIRNSISKTDDELYTCYLYGEKITDDQQVMESIESSLADFFNGKSPVETNLSKMFKQ